MEAIANTFKNSVLRVVKNVTLVTILSLCAVSVEAAPPIAANINIQRAQAIANDVYAHIQASNEEFGWEVAGPHDRTPHYCSQECACLSKKFSAAFKRAGFSTKTVLLNLGKNQSSIEIEGAKPSYGVLSKSYIGYHMVTVVRVIGGWRVVDPIAMQSARLEPFQQWQKRIKTPVVMSVR